MMISKACVRGIDNSFIDANEMKQFMDKMEEMVDEIDYLIYLRKKLEDNTEQAGVLLKQFVTFGAFCREFIEIVHGIIKSLDFKEVNEDEMRHIIEEDD